MRNQFFGDERDYLKYGLLRLIARKAGLRSGVVWMLTPNQPNQEGSRRAYLDAPEKWEVFDPGLYARLGQVPANDRQVALAEQWSFIPEGRYFCDPLPAGPAARADYFQRALAALAGCQLLFFDPDTGIETSSQPRQKRSLRHLYWDEIENAYRQGHSLLIFQYFPRQPRETYLSARAQQFHQRLGVKRVDWFATSQVAFFLLAQPEHTAQLAGVAERVQTQWGRRISAGGEGFGSPTFHLILLPERLAVCRLAPDAPLPALPAGGFISLTRTAGELSLVCPFTQAPAGARIETGWRALMVAGPLDFGLTGVLADLSGALARASVPVFVISTFDTDYLLVKESHLARAAAALQAAGHQVEGVELEFSGGEK